MLNIGEESIGDTEEGHIGEIGFFKFGDDLLHDLRRYFLNKRY